MANWLPYLDHAGPGEHTVTGDVRLLPALHSPQLNNDREILVYLPPSYSQSDRRYPVIYMHDGQNLFDKATSGFGEWQADETMEALSREGIEAIIVGVPHMGNDRGNEYMPHHDSRLKFGGHADRYLAFLTDTVKPLIDADFRTLPDREHTGVAGSSLGGLVSLYALLSRPDVYGFAGIFSPAFWTARGAIYDWVRQQASVPAGRIYLDTGTWEGHWSPVDRRLLHLLSYRTTLQCRRMCRLLQQQGHDVTYLEEKRGKHHEEAWARRLPGALRGLLKDLQ